MPYSPDIDIHRRRRTSITTPPQSIPGAQMEGAPCKGKHSLPGILIPPGGRRGCAVAKGRERQRPVWMPRSPPTPPRLGRGRERDIAPRCKSKPQQARQVERMPSDGAVAAPFGEVRATRGGLLVCHVRDELPPRVSSAGWETLERVRRHNGRTRCQIGRASAGAAEPAHAWGVPPTHRRIELETAPHNQERAATEPVANASPRNRKQKLTKEPQRHETRIPFRGRGPERVPSQPAPPSRRLRQKNPDTKRRLSSLTESSQGYVADAKREASWTPSRSQPICIPHAHR